MATFVIGISVILTELHVMGHMLGLGPIGSEYHSGTLDCLTVQVVVPLWYVFVRKDDDERLAGAPTGELPGC